MIVDDNIASKVKSYQEKFQKYGKGPKALKWLSKDSAQKRYRELVADVDFKGKRILDFGCGFADIIGYISRKSKTFKYTGVDIVPEFIEVCRKRYLKHKFILRDYLANPLSKMYDIVISSGALNSKVKENLAFRKNAIKIMFNHTTYALAFNMAGGYPQPKNKKKYKVYYVNSLKILKFCLTLTSKLIFRQSYHQKDFTIVMFK